MVDKINIKCDLLGDGMPFYMCRSRDGHRMVWSSYGMPLELSAEDVLGLLALHKFTVVELADNCLHVVVAHLKNSISVEGGNVGYAMGSAAKLENTAPRGFERGSGESINFDIQLSVEVDPVNEAKAAQTLRNIDCLVNRLAADKAAQLPRLIQDGEAFRTGGVGMAGVIACDGKYFVVDGDGCYTLEELCEQGRILPSEKGEFSYFLRYLKKYVLKNVDAFSVTGAAA